MLVLAESEGRRESLLDFLRASALDPTRFDSLQEFADSGEKIGLATAALMNGFSWLERGIDFVTETELFASGPVARKRRKQEQVSDVEALIKDLSELNVGDPVVHSAHGVHGGGAVPICCSASGARATPTTTSARHQIAIAP